VPRQRAIGGEQGIEEGERMETERALHDVPRGHSQELIVRGSAVLVRLLLHEGAGAQVGDDDRRF
jgi:hypothetical protein